MIPAESKTTDAESAQFSKLAEHWWDESGPFRWLHRMTPTRMGYLRKALIQHGERDEADRMPLQGMRVLDVGCGGGLLSEPLARLGARVMAIDASAESIDVAKQHARGAELDIDYRCQSMQDFAKRKANHNAFDAACALEILEHVKEPQTFLEDMAKVLKPGGFFAVSTLNRTRESWIKGILAAEIVLGILPKGTHSWRKFIRPSELEEMARCGGLRMEDVCGMRFRLSRGDFYLDPSSLSFNYIASGHREAA